MSHVATEGLTGGYAPGDRAIEDVTFTAGPGELVGLLGANGGGKSTVLRALLGDLPERSGTVRTARAAFVPQLHHSRSDFPVTALDVALMGAYGRTPWFRRIAAGDRAAARRALERVGLAERAGAPFGALSGGQRQRVLIARALVQDEPLLLLDEPFTGVDPESAARLERVLAELRDEGRTLLIATHDVDQARRFDQVLCINRRQIAYGVPREVLTGDVLRRTYGAELIVLDEAGGTAVRLDHHAHDH